jgi:hypothetical protein
MREMSTSQARAILSLTSVVIAACSDRSGVPDIPEDMDPKPTPKPTPRPDPDRSSARTYDARDVELVIGGHTVEPSTWKRPQWMLDAEARSRAAKSRAEAKRHRRAMRNLSLAPTETSAGQVIARWWGNQIRNPPVLNNGDVFQSGMANLISSKCRKQPTEDQILRFESLLADTVDRALRSGRPVVPVGTDYHPYTEISDAANEAFGDTYSDMFTFPWKTMTWAHKDYVEVAKGRGVGAVIIWTKRRWEAHPTTYTVAYEVCSYKHDDYKASLIRKLPTCSQKPEIVRENCALHNCGARLSDAYGNKRGYVSIYSESKEIVYSVYDPECR